MLSSIDLDDQISFQANEINDEITNRVLPSELIAADLPLSKASPKSPFQRLSYSF